MADHTPSPFRLLYRVCSSSDSDFSPYSQLQHTFPALPLTPHAALLVSLAYLPRLPHFPSHHSRNGCKNAACRMAASKILSNQQRLRDHTSEKELTSFHTSEEPTSFRTNEELTSFRSSEELSSFRTSEGRTSFHTSELGCVPRHSPNSTEGFPFSPPLPSPLSPKLLTGLAGTDQHLPGLETTFKELAVNSDARGVPVDSDPVLSPLDSDPKPVLGRTYECASGMVPPASCSPAPFSRLHTGKERGGAKRRSCAISFKVRSWC